MKKILILSGSPRKGGNSDLLCDEFQKGAESVGNAVEKIRVSETNVGYCTGCYYCRDHKGECAKKDDMAKLLEKMIEADVLVLSSPVYFYSIAAQLKTVIDRTVARWLEIKNKEFVYIVTAAEDSDEAMECTLECLRGFAACLSGSTEKGVILGKGVHEKGEIIKKRNAMKAAFEMGQNA